MPLFFFVRLISETLYSLACRWRLQSALRADRESFSVESGSLLDSKTLCRQLRVVLQLLYPTPPSILTLVTWVPQSRLAFGHFARRLAIGPPALAKPDHTVCSLACRCRLRLALRADQESFSIESRPLLDSKALLYSSELSYSCIDCHLHPSRVEYNSIELHQPGKL